LAAAATAGRLFPGAIRRTVLLSIREPREQSLRDMNLPNMVRGPDILKSIVESMQAEIKEVVAVQKQVIEFAEKVDASRKAMTTIQEIHPTICMRDQSMKRGADQSGSAEQRSSGAN
jgi:hypothetical protein